MHWQRRPGLQRGPALGDLYAERGRSPLRVAPKIMHRFHFCLYLGVWPVWKSKFYGTFVLNHRVVLHAINATPARWRGDAGSSPLDRARDGRVITGNDLVKSRPTHCLISTQGPARAPFYRLPLVVVWPGAAAAAASCLGAAAALAFWCRLWAAASGVSPFLAAGRAVSCLAVRAASFGAAAAEAWPPFLGAAVAAAEVWRRLWAAAWTRRQCRATAAPLWQRRRPSRRTTSSTRSPRRRERTAVPQEGGGAWWCAFVIRRGQRFKRET